MPTYDFKCDQCGHVEEVVCSMDEITGKVVWCPDCGEEGSPNIKAAMRRVFSTGGMVFKGTGWPSKAIKRQGEDQDIQRQRRKACVLKDRGDVPQDHVLGLKESDKRFDEKYASQDLDKLYNDSVES